MARETRITKPIASLNKYGAAFHIVDRLAGKGEETSPLLIVSQLAEGYEHHPIQDFRRLKGVHPEWSDEDCREWIVMLSLSVFQEQGLVQHHPSDGKWKLLYKGKRKLLRDGKPDPEAIGKALGAPKFEVEENQPPEAAELVSPQVEWHRQNPRRTLSVSLYPHLPEQATWIAAVDKLEEMTGWNHQRVLEEALRRLFKEYHIADLPPITHRGGGSGTQRRRKSVPIQRLGEE